MDAPLFICFSSKDLTTALDVVAFLESRGLRCWISARDVRAGENYQEAIVQTLEHARGIVFLFSEFSSQSAEIRKELSIGGSIQIPVFPLRLSPIMPTGALRYELATRQWIDIFPDRPQALERLADTIQNALREDASGRARNGTASFVPAVDPAPARAASKAPIVAAGSKEFEAMRTLLARHVGPIAKILVQRAADDANTLDDFRDRLAAHVKLPTDREAFLLAARAQLGTKA